MKPADLAGLFLHSNLATSYRQCLLPDTRLTGSSLSYHATSYWYSKLGSAYITYCSEANAHREMGVDPMKGYGCYTGDLA
jgi:hypothetical protein